MIQNNKLKVLLKLIECIRAAVKAINQQQPIALMNFLIQNDLLQVS